jgi:DNA-binding NarL/FixJ family response regulator
MDILIVDSSILVIQRLDEMLSEMKSISTVYKAQSFEKAINLLLSKPVSLVVLDSRLGIGVINLLKKIKETGSTTTVIILSNYYDDYILGECESHGADFIFDKYFEFEKITGVINTIAANK